MTERFLRIMIQLAVQHCLRSEAAAVANLPPGAPRPTALSFIAIDAAVRLFVCLITQHGGGPALLTKVGALCRRRSAAHADAATVSLPTTLGPGHMHGLLRTGFICGMQGTRVGAARLPPLPGPQAPLSPAAMPGPLPTRPAGPPTPRAGVGHPSHRAAARRGRARRRL